MRKSFWIAIKKLLLFLLIALGIVVIPLKVGAIGIEGKKEGYENSTEEIEKEREDEVITEERNQTVNASDHSYSKSVVVRSVIVEGDEEGSPTEGLEKGSLSDMINGIPEPYLKQVVKKSAEKWLKVTRSKTKIENSDPTNSGFPAPFLKGPSLRKDRKELNTQENSVLEALNENERNNSLKKEDSELLVFDDFKIGITGEGEGLDSYWEKSKNSYWESAEKFCTFLRRRTRIISDGYDNSNELAQTFNQVAVIGDHIIKCAEKLKSGDPLKKIASVVLARRILNLIQQVEIFVFGCHSHFYIESAKGALLDAQRKLFNENKENKTSSEAILSTMESCFEDFLRFETSSSPEELIEYSKESAAFFWKSAREKKEAIDTNKRLEKAHPEDREKYQSQVRSLQIVYDALKETAFAYQHLGDEKWIKQQYTSLSNMKELICEEASKEKEEAEKIGVTEFVSQLSQLSDLVEDLATDEEREKWEAKHPKEFLDEISSLPAEDDTKKIISLGGDIILIPKTDTNFSEDQPIRARVFSKDQPVIARATMCVLELALMEKIRDSNAIRLWRDIFFSQYDNSLYLSVFDVKRFLVFLEEEQKRENPKSHFIDSRLPTEKFIADLERVQGNGTDRIIKFDPNLGTFNPFKENFAMNYPGENEQIVQGEVQSKLIARKFVQEQKMPLIKEEEALERLERYFSNSTLKKGLTDTQFLTLINEEKNRKEGMFDVYKKSLLQGAAYGTGSGLLSVAVAHSPALIMLAPHISLPMYFLIGAGVGGAAYTGYLFWPKGEERR